MGRLTIQLQGVVKMQIKTALCAAILLGLYLSKSASWQVVGWEIREAVGSKTVQKLQHIEEGRNVLDQVS